MLNPIGLIQCTQEQGGMKITKPYILIVGDPINGFAIYGPFDDANEAIAAGDDFSQDSWWVAQLKDPQEEDKI